jgi:hypothetical protein
VIKIAPYKEPEFFRDCLEYFTGHVLLLGYLVSYQYTGNSLLGGWVIYIGTPLYNMMLLNDGKNIDKKNEKAFMNSNLFVIPLWSYIFLFLGVHIYVLALFSTNYQPEWMSNHMKPDSFL